eukprot:COSAG02_NODE_6640_length_3441_cov_24.289348_2_plen_150_part_00
MRYRYNVSAIISPEVMEGQKYDTKVDCFSFGVIIIEMLTFIGTAPVCLRCLICKLLQAENRHVDTTEPELIPRAKFGLTKKNAHAHMGIGAVDEAELRKLLSENVPEDQPPEVHALVALAKRCLKAFPKERPVRFNVALVSTALLHFVW